MKAFVLLILLGALVNQADAASDSPPVKPGYSLDTGSYKGTAILSLATAVENRKDIFTVDIRFINESGGSQFYNPFFNMLLPRPAQVALFDHDGNYVRDMIAFIRGSRANIDLNAWTSIPGDCYVGATLKLPIYNMPNGKYSLQVIFFRSFISSPPTKQALSDGPWFSGTFPNFDSRELFRSNAITILVKDGRVEQDAPEQPPPTPTPK